VPAVADVDRISAQTDPVIRNLQITQCYHELSSAVARLVGGANWCTFATWASKQAGVSIRRQDLVRAFEDLAERSPELAPLIEAVARVGEALLPHRELSEVHAAVRRALNPEAVFARVADAVARGNKRVFEEIGREFARFLAMCARGTAVDPQCTARFCAGLRPGEAPVGQRLLAEAFTAYTEACGQSDAKVQAELTFLANILIGQHEQSRLQPDIEEALNAPTRVVEELKPRLLALLLPSVWLRVRRTVARLLGRTLPLDDAIDRLLDAVRAQARQVTTGALMRLGLPRGEVLRVAVDVRPEFPAILRSIADARVHQVLQRIDVTPDSVAGSGAVDWADLGQRIHFIADFFRAWHARPELFDAPFTTDQTKAAREGRVPEGRL
jgi:hypothetical protein